MALLLLGRAVFYYMESQGLRYGGGFFLCSGYVSHSILLSVQLGYEKL